MEARRQRHRGAGRRQRRDRDIEGVEGEEGREGVSPPLPNRLGVRGTVVSSPRRWIRGGAPTENGFW